MRADELATTLLQTALDSLRREYMDKLILAARENRGDDVDQAATWCALLDDVGGAVAAALFEHRKTLREVETQ
jgi:hypothetical protein